MGRKNREERREKREDYAAKITKNKRKSNLMAAGILTLIALIVGYSGYVFVTMDADVPGAPPGAGKLGGGCPEISLFSPFGWIKFQTKQGVCFVCQDKTV